jgi:hypothetical protein
MKELTNKGIGVRTNSADPVLPADEKQLWESGVFDPDTAVGLTNIVFFYNGKTFGFRAVDEHPKLQASQFKIKYDHELQKRYLEYTGRLCKNVQGGLKQRNVEVKQVKHVEEPANPRCLVKLFEKYLSLIPPDGSFYRKPLDPLPGTKGPRYGKQNIGINTLKGMYRRFFENAGRFPIFIYYMSIKTWV